MKNILIFTFLSFELKGNFISTFTFRIIYDLQKILRGVNHYIQNLENSTESKNLFTKLQKNYQEIH